MRPSQLTKAEKSLHDQINILPGKQLLTAFGTLSAALLIACIDQNGISVTLPTISRDLSAESTISWAGTASLLANTTFQMLYGRLSDILGRKTIFIATILILSAADLLCGLSKNAPMFYVFRGIAGIGGGGITNLSMIIVSDIVTLDQRGKYQGIIGSIVGFANVIGPFIAALIVQKAIWRGFFFLLAPLSILAAVLTYFFLPSKPPTADFKSSISKVDWAGALLISAGVILLLIPISGGGSYFQWSSPMIISMLAIGSVSFIAFVTWEWKLAKLPLMPVDIYKNYAVSIMLTQSFLLGAVYQSYLYYVPLYLQNAHQYSVMTSALLYMPMVISQCISSILSGQYISRFKRYGEVIMFGFGTWTLGAGLALILKRDTHPAAIATILSVVGVGVGSVFQPTLIALQANSPISRRAIIISNRNFYRCAGGACGLTVSAALLQARLRSALPAEYKYLATSTYSVPSAGESQVPGVLDAYMAASHSVFILQLPLIGLCFLGTALLKDRGLEPVETDQPNEPVVSQG
ncbi:unnamed protein product [Clonostachys byssicola]|uniref:Major facilitator superfamily (MFS) profile domain-containing protein n=1 Tax=Clonostachys byssicola TaxID=160290 RepID=A0A9N9U9A5_9HYPO|nr:unnamed protein product [Clonostachys byssicola]